MTSLSPRLLASIVAVPVAVVTGAIVFQQLQPADAGAQAPAPQATGPVTVAAATLTERQATVCRALTARLPEKLGQAVRRPVTAGHEQNAAYGDPASVLECGVAKPQIGMTDFLVSMNGVCWHSVTGSGKTIWTTIDREVPVRVTVPGPMEGAAQQVVPFATTIATTVPSTSEKLPSGCF
ncbi:hypothetical protein F4553_005623 [Allocatelliglobosispora scoriae]|uniref:DUF3515 domain-containing protein n=1 Tax=Allocatelliglobosispora scoriae TaxID=643052 RepID=A0A841BYJ8_9ACTN|nr:DUF3515 domain-containing protein [Allocatelliglobosispora scoriae]MBB5872189.1 hypothetical protein [Allocatelliglobosispora scoriae]